MGLIKSPDAVLISTESASHGFDDIGDNQATGAISATAEAGGRWDGKAMLTDTDHGLTHGQPIVIEGTGPYAGNTRVLRKVSSSQFIINKDYSPTATTAGWSSLGGKSAWSAFMPLEADVPASSITTLTFWDENAQSGTQDVDTYTKDKMYYFPGVIKEIVLSAGNLRLFRYGSLNPGGQSE